MAAFLKREHDYAVRICAFLAGLPEKTTLPLSSVAEKLYLTVPFTRKIVHQLIKNDILSSVQGKNGGIYLKQAAENLSIYDILQAMGFDMPLNECTKIKGFCPLSGNCKVHQFFMEQEQALHRTFKEKKISELAFSFEPSLLTLG